MNLRTARRWTQDPTEAGAQGASSAATYLRSLTVKGISTDGALAILGFENVGLNVRETLRARVPPKL